MLELKLLKKHDFIFKSDGDLTKEKLVLKTYFLKSPESKDLLVSHDIEFVGYYNAATIHLLSICLSPDKLRKLADELETIEKELSHERS